MAWDNGKYCGVEIISGDKPVDELSMALRKISVEYEERFGRKPSLAEVLYTINIVINSTGFETISDSENIKNLIIKY